MADYQITHSRKDGADRDRRLDGFLVGGDYHTIDAVIGFIRQGHRFWVTAQGKSVWVVTRRHAHGVEYLTTEGDGFPPNNLLNLPDC